MQFSVQSRHESVYVFLSSTQGVPTTRAGTCVSSDTRVERDIQYNGNTILERATIITRIAPTFLRFGSFEIFKTTDRITGMPIKAFNGRRLVFGTGIST